MTKYDQAFRQKLVKEYLAGGAGFTSLSSRYGISRSVLRSWVSRYSHHGQSALSKKQGYYSAEFKLSVLTTMWQQELSYRQASAMFDLRGGANVVSIWERSYHEGGLDALKPKPRGRPKKMKPTELPKAPETQTTEAHTLEQLRRENEQLRAEVAYLKKLDALVRAKKSAARTKRKP